MFALQLEADPDGRWRFNGTFRSGARMGAVSAVTVIVVSSTSRRNAYSQRQWREHAAIHAALTGDPQFRERCLTEAWTHPRPTHLRGHSLLSLLRVAVLRMQGRIFQYFGGDPMTLCCYYRFPRKWGFIPGLRATGKA